MQAKAIRFKTQPKTIKAAGPVASKIQPVYLHTQKIATIGNFEYKKMVDTDSQRLVLCTILYLVI